MRALWNSELHSFKARRCFIISLPQNWCVFVCARVSFPTTPKEISPKTGKNTHPIHELSRYSPLCSTCISTFYSCVSTIFAWLFTSCRFSCLHSPSRDHDQGRPHVNMATLPTEHVQSDSPNWRLCGLLWTPPRPLMPTGNSGTALLPLQAHVTDYSSSWHRHVRHGLWFSTN